MEYTGPERRITKRRIHLRRNDETRTYTTRRNIDRRKDKKTLNVD